MLSSSCATLPASKVTVVLATYNRPDTLRVAIRSVLRQTFKDWTLVVVGDHCDPRTEQVVNSFSDERICLINLPARFGEQAGPNSVGMALARTEYIALLNHDDVFLPDHLHRALKAMEKSGGNLFLGRAAIARKSIADEKGIRRPIFSLSNPVRRSLPMIFHRHNGLVEPVSTWVFSTALARRIGPWNSHRNIIRLPPQNWVLRAWRAGGRFVFGKDISVLSLATQYQYPSEKGSYSRESAEHKYIDIFLENTDTLSILSHIEADLDPGEEMQGMTRVYGAHSLPGRLLVKLAANSVTAGVYRLTGLDICSALLPFAGARKGEGMEHLFKLRTGADAPIIENYRSLLDRTISQIGGEKWT